ncbi:endolytic transglycosylase MltG [Parasulfitobacter algicola]|uniref:Endolytic murein transglycosylase n=1 Tax=Parasulfitobacter algicola TaxID=2614809 RepID=A0ABX2INN7_9RHOB|nr:endolytic transglycosylase MltG [Sulfitobacter algicola]NSX54509.1 endolytic transglycosylase MltG [Sulfitobacter algicola]
MWRHIASNALTLFVFLLFIGGGAVVWGTNKYTSEGPLDQAICLQVPSGSSMSGVSQSLVEKGAISDGTIFRIGADYEGKTTAIKAGSFLIPENASMSDILQLITQSGRSTCGTVINYRIGVLSNSVQVNELNTQTQAYQEIARFNLESEERPAEYQIAKDSAGTRFQIVVAEGTTTWGVVEALKQIDILEGEIEEVPTEGSLAPEGYEVRAGMDRNAFIAQLAALQQQRVEKAWTERVDGLPLENREEVLILASIIEKETGVARERGQVASVFVNRLNQGMKLQTDPTVIYGITNGRGALGRGLRRSELRAATEYNTYVIPAMPPTPIANPGLASIEAAVNPENTDYIFFVADGTGGHAFAETLDEHNRNVARWREIEAERANQSSNN